MGFRGLTVLSYAVYNYTTKWTYGPTEYISTVRTVYTGCFMTLEHNCRR